MSRESFFRAAFPPKEAVLEIAVGLDVGASSIKGALVTQVGEVLEESHVPFSQDCSPEEFLEGLFQATRTLLPLSPKAPIGIGIGSPGPLDTDTGVLIASANLPRLREVPVRQSMESAFSLPVFYNNDANCAALAESLFGESKDWESSLFLTLGTGIGGGFVEKGKLFQGWKGNGIEIGHITSVIGGAICGCGQKGCVEAYFSTRGLLERFREKTSQSLPNAKAFFDLVRQGSPQAREVLNFGVLCLAEAVRSTIHLLNPEGVVFVGGITKAWDLFGETLEKEIRSRIFPVLEQRLKVRVGKELAGAIGAASLVFSS